MVDIVRMPKIEGGFDLTGIPEAKKLLQRALPYFALRYEPTMDAYRVALKHGTRIYWSECLVTPEVLASKTEDVTYEQGVSVETAVEFSAESIATGLAIAVKQCLEQCVMALRKRKVAPRMLNMYGVKYSKL